MCVSVRAHEDIIIESIIIAVMRTRNFEGFGAADSADDDYPRSLT